MHVMGDTRQKQLTFSYANAGDLNRFRRATHLLLCMLTVAFGMLLHSACGSAQEITGDLAGTVTHSTGAVIPGANVTATNLGTGAVRTVTSGAAGEFVFSHLALGACKVTGGSTGFKTFDLPSVNISAGDRLRIEMVLQLGSRGETVEVTAEEAALQTDSGSVASTISEKAVQDLPLNGRNFISLVQVQPGVNAGVPNSVSSGSRPDDRRATSTVSANGQQDVYNNNMIDGLDNNDRFQGLTGIRPSLEALREINVVTNTYDPELGRTSGAVISMLTKSGTNNFVAKILF